MHKVVLRLPDSCPNWNLEMLVLSERRREPTTNYGQVRVIVMRYLIKYKLYDTTLIRTLCMTRQNNS